LEQQVHQAVEEANAYIRHRTRAGSAGPGMVQAASALLGLDPDCRHQQQVFGAMMG
jgi:hypothetical protein